MRFVKVIVVFSLIISTLANTLLVPLVYLDFNLRRDYIATVLCINRDKPITMCGGHCFLAKQLNKAQEQQENDQNINLKPQFTFFKHEVQTISLESGFLIQEMEFPFVVEHISNSAFADIFHPPRLV